MNWTKFLGVVLPLSVAANLVLVGFLAGQALPDRWFPGPLRERPAPAAGPVRGGQGAGIAVWTRDELDIMAAARTLRDPDRRRVQEIMQRRAPEVRASWQETMTKRRALIGLLNNPPADVSVLETAFAEVTEANAAAQKKGQEVFIEVAKELDAEARASFLRATGNAERRQQRRGGPQQPPGRQGQGPGPAPGQGF